MNCLKYLEFTYYVKEQTLGVALDVPHDLFWMCEYIPAGPFARPLSAHFSYVKFIQQRFMTICILNFKSYITTKVKKYILLEDIFVFENIDYYPSYGRSGNF